VTIQLSRRTIAIALAAFLAFAAVATTSLVLTLTGRAEANHRFSDIANGTFFHAPTAWLADNGIADGFGDGTFRPNNNITRGQAAYWFRNYNDATSDWQFSSVIKPAQSPNVSHSMNCPNGERPLAGGGSTIQDNLHIRDSRPASNIGNTKDIGWHVTWNVIGASFPSNALLTVWVLCAPPAS
jgi:hypothetical protein